MAASMKIYKMKGNKIQFEVSHSVFTFNILPKIRKLVDEVIVRNDAQSLDEYEERPLDLSVPNSSTV